MTDEYNHRRTQVERDERVELPEDAVAVSMEIEPDHNPFDEVTVHYLVPVADPEPDLSLAGAEGGQP